MKTQDHTAEKTKPEARAAETDVSNAVYGSCAGIFESLERAGKIRGNGHHMAQKVAEFAEQLLRERWIAEPPAAK